MAEIISKDYKPGELVLRCQPWISSINVAFCSTVCANCVIAQEDSATIRKCRGCHAVGYCGTECQKRHWKSEHKYECAMMRRLMESNSIFQTSGNLEVARNNTMKLIVLKFINKVLLGNDSESENSGDLRTKIHNFLATKLVVPTYGEIIGTEVMIKVQNPEALTKDKDVGQFFSIHEQKALLKVAFDLQDDHMQYKIMDKVNLEEIFFRFRTGSERFVFNSCTDVDEQGYGFYFQPPQMTRSCDANVCFHFQGKELFVRATQPIKSLTHFSMLKVAHPLLEIQLLSVQERQLLYVASYGKKCECRICSNELNAELLPLRCAKKACSEPIPSDGRAEQPCRKCGSVLGVSTLQEGRNHLESMFVEHRRPFQSRMFTQSHIEELEKKIQKFSTDALVHPENWYRLLAAADLSIEINVLRCTSKMTSGFKQVHPLIPLLRKGYPEISHGLAVFLVHIGIALEAPQKLSREEAHACISYLKEAEKIFNLLHGTTPPQLAGLLSRLR